VLRLLGRDGLGEQRRTVRQAGPPQDGVTLSPLRRARRAGLDLDPVTAAGRGGMATPRAGARATGGNWLDLILADLYGPRDCCRGPHPAGDRPGPIGLRARRRQIRVPVARQLFIARRDLARGPDGQWQVLGDQTQAPSAPGTPWPTAGSSPVAAGLYRDTRIHASGRSSRRAGRVAGAGAVAGRGAPRSSCLTPAPQRDRVRPGLPVHAARLPARRGQHLTVATGSCGSGPSDA